jgi:hypothetical protein
VKEKENDMSKRLTRFRVRLAIAGVMLATLAISKPFIITKPARAFNVLTVTNINDNGPGSLRQAIIDANPGDSIIFNLSPLPATITLGSEIAIGKSLTISGPGPAQLTLSGGSSTQLTGNATLYLKVAQGVWQTFRVIDTNPSAVCKC